MANGKGRNGKSGPKQTSSVAAGIGATDGGESDKLLPVRSQRVERCRPGGRIALGDRRQHLQAMRKVYVVEERRMNGIRL